jgi:hypothetical protein
MERTVPSRGSEHITLYIRTYYSLLRSSHEVQIKTLIEAHTRMSSALHIAAHSPEPDMAAFIYSVLRLPGCLLSEADRVILGQSAELFARHGYTNVQSWTPVGQPARRRLGYFDGQRTVALFINSRSDIDDLIPTLTAFEIERDKLRRLLNNEASKQLLAARKGQQLSAEDLGKLSEQTGIPADDLERLDRIWGDRAAAYLADIAARKHRFSVRLLGSSLADYNRATRNWWVNIDRSTPEVDFRDRPVYFISSNNHSLANLLSGYALQREQEIIDYIQANGDENMRREYADIQLRNVPSNRENFLYYALKKYEAEHQGVTEERIAHEQLAGITRLPSRAAHDLEAQVIPLHKVRRELMDPRLGVPGLEKLADSNAVILNIDFPLGMAAYGILSEIASNVDIVRGIYIMGKAATLNGRIGDVMISGVVHDEQSLNTYLFDNCFAADDVAPYLVYGNVLDTQKAISVRGTFLQNDDYMSVFYKEGYTVIEMEAGPFLSAFYEMVRPQRYPRDEIVDLHATPIPMGVLHYASDTPFSKGKNLGSQNLSYFGMDPTYATMIAVIRAVFEEEIRWLSGGRR